MMGAYLCACRACVLCCCSIWAGAPGSPERSPSDTEAAAGRPKARPGVQQSVAGAAGLAAGRCAAMAAQAGPSSSGARQGVRGRVSECVHVARGTGNPKWRTGGVGACGAAVLCQRGSADPV